MLYREDWEKVQERYKAYWARENHDRPLISLSAPKNRTEPSTAREFRHQTIRERWLDTEYMLWSANEHFRNTYYAGESFPALCPNLGPDIFAACFGTALEFGESTSWAVHHLTDEVVENYSQGGKPLRLDRQSFYYQKILEMTKAAVEDGKDKYIVGITDIHPGADGLVSMRGPEKLCMDTVDHPGFIKKAAFDLFDGFREMVDELYGLTTRYQQGSSNWMGVWHPEKWYVTSCDFCCMVSEDMFSEFIMEELLAELDILDASLFHLDGPGALRHLDRLLSIDTLNGVQWVYGSGQPSASHWLDVLQKIQKAGKLIHVSIQPSELDCMLENLSPEGVMLTTYAGSPEEADALVKKAEAYKKKVF